MHYREARFYFFTGTGNSYRVATWMAGAARDEGVNVVLCAIESARPSHDLGTGEAVLLGLVMPTHGFTAPWAMLRFALRLPRRTRTHGLVVATRAGLKIGRVFTPGIEGTATYLIALILALKGYRVRGAIGVDMPSNWIALHPGLSPRAVAAIVARARISVARFIETILSGQRRFVGWGSLVFGLLTLPISLAYLCVGRPFLGKLFFASGRCNGCGLCVRYCPKGALRMRGSGRHGRPYWTLRCESCMRCMAFCPTRAVEANYLLGVGAYLLAGAVPTTALLAWLAVRAPLLTFLNGIPRWLLESVYGLVAITLAYPVLHLLLKVGWINWFFARATPTRYYRRYHEPETSLQDLGRRPGSTTDVDQGSGGKH